MYPPHHLGGYELSCRDVMDRLAARGHDVTVLTTTMRLAGVEDPPGERADGIRRELDFYWDDHRIIEPSFRRRLEIERHNQRTLRQALNDAKPDVISVWNMGAMSMGLLTTAAEARIPLVLSVCDEWPVYAPFVDAWIRPFVGRPRVARLVRRATGLPTTLPDLGTNAVFLYNSEFIRKRIEDAAGIRPGLASIVYTGIDPHDFPIADRAASRPWRWTILYVGRIDDRKGVHVAVDALAALPKEATLEIVGRGDPAYLAALRERVRRLGLDGRVRFSESPRAELKERFAAADVVVFPTIWEEPFGLVPVEAMACGTPVIATGTGGSGEFLRDGVNNLRIPPDDAGALAAAIEQLAGDPDLRERIASAGLKTAAELTVDRLADVMEGWHRAAASGFREPLPAGRRLDIA
jgi:glycosyltransferase involved in cell wall biosynthesis